MRRRSTPIDRRRGCDEETAIDGPDIDLIEATRHGDQDAFAELFARHYAVALRHAVVLTNDETLAADLVSESYSKMLSLLQRGLGPSTNFKSYLMTTVKNVHIDHLRKHQREILTEDYGDVPASAIALPDGADSWAESSAIAEAFRSLPEQWRQTLWHTEVLGESLDDAARQLGSNANAVGVLRFRAREGLRQAYLAAHLDVAVDSICRDFGPTLTQYVRGKAAPGRAARFEAHLAECGHCQRAVAVAADINGDLGAVLGPALIATAGLEAARRTVTAGLFAHPGPIAGVAAGLAGVAGLAFLFVPADAPDARPPAQGPPLGMPTFVEGATISPRPPRTTPTPAPEPAASGQGPIAADTAAPVPPQPTTPTTALPQTPSPTVEPPLRLGEPRASTVRSGETAVGLVRIEAGPGDRSLRLRVTLENAKDVTVLNDDGTWTCTRESAVPGSLALSCAYQAQDPPDPVALSLSVTIADPDGDFGGLLLLTDGTSTESRRFSAS